MGISIHILLKSQQTCNDVDTLMPRWFKSQQTCSDVDTLTHWGRDKMVAIFQTTFSNGFSWMKMYEFRLTFHWSLFLRVQLTIFHHWFRQWFGAVQVPSHYLNQWWLDYRCIYASLGLNKLMIFMMQWQHLHYVLYGKWHTSCDISSWSSARSHEVLSVILTEVFWLKRSIKIAERQRNMSDFTVNTVPINGFYTWYEYTESYIASIIKPCAYFVEDSPHTNYSFAGHFDCKLCLVSLLMCLIHHGHV